MNLNCTQVSSLLSFYINNKLNQSLNDLIKLHLDNCQECRQKYETLKRIFSEFSNAKDYIDNYEVQIPVQEQEPINKDFALVKTLSAYIDNELSDEESLRVKKYVVTNLTARKTLEEIYTLKKLLHESFDKSREMIKDDYSKIIFRQLNIQEEIYKEDPMIKVVSMLVLIVILFITGAIFVFWT